MGKTMQNFTEQTHTLGLYDPQFEHDACGIGAVVDIKGRKSHQTVDDALCIVERLEHRAGKDAEGKTGDGVGILLQISHKFFSKVADELNIRLGNEREYGVGMFFFPQNEHMRAQAMKLFEVVTRKEGLEFLAWRKVPVDPDAVGQKARDCMPSIWQCFIKKPAKVSKGIDFDRKLYVVRRVFEQASNGTYVPSLSSRTIVYKGMFLVHDLRLFYADLQDPDYESAIGMVHSRFSTNTNPSWMRAHPNRFILHNGEINTIKGNTDAMLAREESISSPILQDDMNKILPIINTSGYSGIQYIIGRKIPDHLDSPDSCTYLTDTTLCQDDFLLPQLSGHIAVPPYFLFISPIFHNLLFYNLFCGIARGLNIISFRFLLLHNRAATKRARKLADTQSISTLYSFS